VPAARRRFGLLLVVAFSAACSAGGGVPGGASTSTVATSTTTSTTTTTLPPLCSAPSFLPALPPADTRVEPLAAEDLAAASVQFSSDTFGCAADVVLVSPGDLERAALAARLAAGLEGPLLFAGAAAPEAVEDELARLIPQRVWLVGADVAPPLVPEGTEVRRLSGDAARLATQVDDLIGGGAPLVLPSDDVAESVAVAIRAMVEGAALEPPPSAATTTTGAAAASSTTVPQEGGAVVQPLPVVIAGAGDRGVAWLVDARQPELALAAAAAAVPSGGIMALVDGTDLRRVPEVGRALRGAPGGLGLVRLVGDISDDASWELPLLLEGQELPGGGYLLFPGRRLVALYGNPLAAVLGVLGEQGPEASVQRILPIAAQYAQEGVVVVPAFEMIATVADSRPGADGDYSNETPLGDLRPYIEAAGEAGLYVLLDLQPGRADFLSQARLYEEFLRLPYVGLALDPEWHLGPNELPLHQYGHASAADVNAVAQYLAGLVREEHLPQKMLLLHQFRLSMLPDRGDIEMLPELAVVIQMDGQGALVDKYATWAAITAGTEGAGWFWGWKNFYDEDSPMATPQQVLELVPSVVYVSYQ
jgi:hypothetical protein